MSAMSIRRLLRLVIPLLVAGFGVLVMPTTAGAAVQTFHRFAVVPECRGHDHHARWTVGDRRHELGRHGPDRDDD